MFKKIVLGGVVLLSILSGIFVYNKVSYVGELVDPLTYFDEFNGNVNNLVYEDTRIDANEPIQIVDEKAYISYDVVSQSINDRIFYDYNEKVLTLTSSKEIVRLYEGDNHIKFKGHEGDYSLITLGDTLYIEASLMDNLFGVTIERGKDGRLFVATDISKNQTIGTVHKKVQVRTHPAKKSTVVEVLPKGSKVTIYSEADGFVRVRSENGIIGYLPESDIKVQEVKNVAYVTEQETWQQNPLGETVKMMWDEVYNQSNNNWANAKYTSMKNVNVIAPAWFEFENSNGSLSNRASEAYVKEAHDRNIEVWAILRHNLEEPSLTREILSSTDKRQKVIKELLDYAEQYHLDGINVDIENIQEDFSKEWVQFMRELYPQLKAKGLTVSVDVYAPSAWSGHYERGKISESSDYFMIMAYDQYWSGSEEAGSVAELPWTEEGIIATLEEVPKEKLVLGMPFYSRLWKETSNGLETRAYSMDSVEDLIDNWGVVPRLDEVSGQNYAEYIKDGNKYRIWIEDKQSIEKRLKLMEKYDLAGYAAWRLGYETNDIWDILENVE